MFGVENGFPEVPPRYNIAPTQPALVVRESEAGRAVALLRWGLIPSWAKDPSIGARAINARAETVADKPSFRAAARRRRCLVPASGFYEWKREGKARLPYFIFPVGAPAFAFAAIRETWGGADGSEIESFAILTTDANETIAPVHDRMPVVLDPADFARWLDPETTDFGAVADLARPFPPDRVVLRRVSGRVNSVHNEGPECLAPPEAEPGQGSLF